MKTIIHGGTVVNEGHALQTDIIIDEQEIVALLPPFSFELQPTANVIDATGCYVLPGIIDTHVHFREPGLTDKGDIESESRAAAAGGVTTVFDMPNTVPQTTTLEALADKQQRAAHSCHVNYAFFFGATNDNYPLFEQLDVHAVPGIKLFMGSSTGNMLVDRDEALDRIFAAAAPLPIMAHCEDTAIINRNMAEASRNGEVDPPVSLHSLIRSEEACLASSRKAVALARKHHARLHIAHVSTADELDLICPDERLKVKDERYDYSRTEKGVSHPADESHHISHLSSFAFPLPAITAEVTLAHLLFSALDYPRLGTRIKVNPSVKSPVDQFMLRQALTDGRITTVATDHAPHLLSQKEGGSARAASGMPMVQFSLVAMLELVDAGVLTIERLVELMAHNPAHLFEIRQRGFIRPGYQADLTIVRPRSPWTVTPDMIKSRCGWSPVEGHEYQWRVEQTLCNGHLIYNKGKVDSGYVGQPVRFR